MTNLVVTIDISTCDDEISCDDLPKEVSKADCHTIFIPQPTLVSTNFGVKDNIANIIEKPIVNQDDNLRVSFEVVDSLCMANEKELLVIHNKKEDLIKNWLFLMYCQGLMQMTILHYLNLLVLW